jgi:hypothetical protein
MALGAFNVVLKRETPQDLIDMINAFGHIVIVPGRLNPREYGDGLLLQARYVGVVRAFFHQPGGEFEFKGVSLAHWLGDEDDKGDLYEVAKIFTNETFANTVRELLPEGGGITEGTIHSVPGLYNGKHQYETPRKALDYVVETYSTDDADPIEWRVNNDGTLDAGPISELYATEPSAILVKDEAGHDMALRGLEATMSIDLDVEDYTTRLVLLAQGEGDSISTGTADSDQPTPYKDLHGNPVIATRVLSESQTMPGNANDRAAVQIKNLSRLRRAIQISSDEYDIKGEVRVGDPIYIYDPAGGFYDVDVQTFWKGQPINPMLLRVIEMTWPIRPNWTVAYRDADGVYWDLSDYYKDEEGATSIAVGDYLRTLAGFDREYIGIRPNIGGADSTIPAAPTFNTPFQTGNYQSASDQWTRSVVLVDWDQPLNADGSTITDGGHYELRYRINAFVGYDVQWGDLEAYKWGELETNKWGAPITLAAPSDAGEWHQIFIGWGQTQFLVQELTPGVEYEFQIRAVDSADPPHAGPYSTSEFVVASRDLFAPSQPAAPEVAASLIAVQVTHRLGNNAGGEFNLEPDIAYLEIHLGTEAEFTATPDTMIGKLPVNAGLIVAQIPAVGTFPIPEVAEVWILVVAVDLAGNRSQPSESAPVTAELIDDAHISDLTVTKVTAGTMTANWIVGGRIATALSGQRVELTEDGFFAYDSFGDTTVEINAQDGTIKVVGRIQTDINGNGVTLVPGGNARMELLPQASDDHIVWVWSDYFTGAEVKGEMSIRRRSDDDIDGGKLLVWEQGAVLSHQPDSSDETYFGVSWPFDESFFFHGKFVNWNVLTGLDGLVAGYTNITEDGGGTTPSGVIITWGPTMSSQMLVMGGIAEQTLMDVQITDLQLTSFTMTWNVFAWGGSGGLAMWWAWRTT